MRKKNILVLIGFVLICTFVNYFYFQNNNSKALVSKNIIALEENNEDKKIVQNLKEEFTNDEIVGYLRIPNTDFKVPITQTIDNSKYLYTDAYGKSDIKGNPFLDYRVDINNSKKLLIFGHNSVRYDAPFKYLENYYDKDFYEGHKYIELVTDSNIFRYKIFSVYVETGDWSYMKLDNDFKSELNMYKSRSLYDTGVKVFDTNDILILQTCSTNDEYSKYSKKYLLIISRRVE